MSDVVVRFFCHWQLNGAVPLATTENVALCPAIWLPGCAGIFGAAAIALAEKLVPVTFPAVMVTLSVAGVCIGVARVAGIIT